ncbi:hypothetical protein Calkro_0663 [Caldicellulosiruptor kronotskyensis 2002]|uniref:SLH domain-containing protein n=1 Tax=Caldicellulosiruptor kronotskyensis (strain DSM 18902 / VKM B-2412 / 2002) TaxID=632348 RepID=E4SER9_CALK2|nr:hypothetical protein [Caldicellulosiruptor kronotskyensis]ADQ45556.1 hypothetical protein Calkro_0663 [Caldicellulosiruptor kronotskyensis 2002]
MRKLLSFLLILSLLLSFAFPVAQAGTITQKVQAAINKIDYITAGEFVTSLLLGANVKPNGIADYWSKAVSMGLIPGEVKQDKPLTRAQASYIVWKLINAVPELKNKNIPVSVRRVPPTEAFMRGICFFGGPGGYENEFGYVPGYDLDEFIQGYQLLILEYKYADGSTTFKYVWDRYKGISLAPGTYKSIDEPFFKMLAEFKKKYPDKVVYAPRPWQKGWLFAMDVVRDTKGIPATIDASVHSSIDYARQILTKDNNVVSKFTKLGYPITRRDIAQINYGYYFEKKGTTLKGYYGYYDIKEHPYFNMYFEDFLVNYPRKYPTDHTRFAYYCKDYYKIPQLYREPMLRLADLGIITPDQSALYIGVYYFNAGKTLTRAEAVQMIARVFDKSKRDVLDEVSVKMYRYWIPQNEVGTGKYVNYDSQANKFVSIFNADEMSGGVTTAQKQATFRIEEPKSLGLAKTMVRNYPNNYYIWFLLCRNTQVGFTYSASFRCDNVITETLMYDEAGMTGLVEWDKNKAINYIPVAYRDEFKKDVNTYTAKYLTSKNMFLVKQYGDVYVCYNCWIDRKTIQYQIYPSKPQISGATFFTAKPNPNHKQ